MQLSEAQEKFSNFFRKKKRLILMIAIITLYAGQIEGRDQSKCAEGQSYDTKLDLCTACDSKCKECDSQGNLCAQCKDPTMLLDSATGLCQCPVGTFFSMFSQLCETETITYNQTRQSRLKFTSQQRRNLQTVVQTQGQVIKAGQNTTFTGVEFKVTDSTYDQNFMFTVDSYVKDTYVTFKDSIIDVKGNFFQSIYPVRLIFDNCIFKVSNTLALLHLDYTNNGCGADLDAGSLTISNSQFIETTSQPMGSQQKTLFNIKSLYDITLSNISFSGIKQKQLGLISDHGCSSQPAKPQKVFIDQLSVSDSNFQMQLSFTNFSTGSIVKPNQLYVHLTNLKIRNVNMGVPFFTINSKRDQSSQVFNMSRIEADSLIMDSVPLINLQLALSTGWSILANQISVTNSRLTDFLGIEGGDSFHATGPFKIDTIDNMIPQAQNVPDAVKSALISLTGTVKVSFIDLAIQGSSLLKSPAIVIDTVSTLEMTNCMFSSLQVQLQDLVVVRKVVAMTTSNVTVMNILNSQIDQTRYAFTIATLNLVKDKTIIKMEKPTLKNSQIPLLSVKGVNLQNPFDASKYLISLQYCQLSNNLFNGYDLLSFTDLPTQRLDLENIFCIPESSKPQCTAGLYYDTIMKACTKCPKGCSSCNSEQECTGCSVSKMIVNQMNGQCECPSQQYYYDIDGLPRCRDCLSKCQTCQNEYQCLTYKSCPNNAQYLNLTSKQCGFQCAQGFLGSDKTCKQCQDSNCAICDVTSLGQERCGLCQNGYFLDLVTYQCVASCPANSKAISSNNTQSKGKNYQVRYCRPFVSKTPFEYAYYVNPNSTSHLELGTLEYPFKNMDSPAKEIFNFMYEKETNFTVYHNRGTSMKHYYGVMPIIIVNVKMYTLLPYGDEKLPKPRVYVTGHDYLWPDSTLFSLAETFYDFTTRVQRGDMDVSESTKFFLKFNVFRSSMTIQKIDFQSIMFGDAWSNPLIFSFDAPNRTVLIEDCYLDLDGALYEAYFPISLKVRRSHFNLTNYQYGVWNDFRWDCYTNKATDVGGYLIIEDSKFTGKHQQALYNFLFFSSFDDFILRNNTFDSCTYLDMETRPFLDVHPQSMCDPDFRTQNVFIDNNKFLNLDQSSLMFAVNYMNNFNGTKVFSMQNNYYENSIINSQFISMQIQNPSKVTVGNNYYKNVTVLKDKKVFYFFSEQSNITIRNETLINNVLDDLYTIGAAKNVLVEDFLVINNTNTGAITETSAVLRVSTARNSCQISRFSVSRSKFKYGKAIEIEQAKQLIFNDASYHLNSLQNQDFFVFNQIVNSEIRNLKFTNFTKASDKSRFALSMPTLTLVPGLSDHIISNISFTDSQSSFISIQQVQNSNNGGIVPEKPYKFSISNCQISKNQLQSKDPLIEFGEINYMNFSVSLDQVNILDNILELGTIYQLKLNCRELTIRDSQIARNVGQFALLEPASSDEQNPLNFFMSNTNFVSNFARADALIQLTSNSVMRAYNSKFVENYSTGRGSVVFADYQAVYALFQNCDFIRNYAYQGGAFYVQYSSQVEISNCTITQNFAIIGGVAYVNNDGQIKINKGSRVYKNSALNSCFLFLINTQFESMIDNITITQNDQLNALIKKDEFLDINGPYMHFKADFFEIMQAISDKVQRTINERADTAIYAIKAKVNLTNTEIYKNDVILSASTESVVSLTNTTLRDIYATGKIITAVSSAIEMSNVTIKNVVLYTGQDIMDKIVKADVVQKQFESQGSSFKQSGSPITAPATSQSLQFQEAPLALIQPQTSLTFFKISIVNKSFLKASNCTFEMIQGTFLYVSGSNLIIDSNSTIQDLNSEETESELFMIDTSAVVIQDTKFQRLNQSYVTPILRFQESTLNFQRGSFRDFNKTLFFLEGGNFQFDTLRITKGRMTWLENVEPYMVNSIVFDVSAADLSISNGDFDGIFTNFSSPIIYIENDPAASEKHKLALYKSRFTNNVANETAGVILSINTNVTIDGCYFANNSALLKDAGALYLDCQDSSTSPCLYDIKNTQFINNSAKINGGAIKYTYYPPNTQTNNSFSLNKAQYGSNLASFPVQMRFSDVKTSRILNQSEVAKLDLTNAIVYELDKALVSGSLMSQTIILEILDEQNRTLITDNSSVAIMSSQSPNVTVMKSKSVKASFGRFTFDDVIVVGPPGTDILLKVNTDSISKEKIANAYPLLKRSFPDIYIKGRLRLCLKGEFQTTDYKCIMCSDGFFTLEDNQSQCKECPENAVCTEGYNILLDSGYWRENTSSIDIFECYNKNACIGGNMSTCAPGYEGKLCHSCSQYNGVWYSREQTNECVECLSYSSNSWRLAGVSILILLYFTVLIYVNIRAVSEGSVRLSTVYMRILTNYFQILTLASSYDLSWSDNMKLFLQYISIISQASEILFSVDCFLRDNGILSQPHYFKMVMACIFPFIAICLVAAFWGLIHYFKKSQKVLSKLVMSIIILIFMTLPTVTSITFAIYNCVDVFGDGNTYMALDVSQQCWNGDHNYYAKNLGIPIITLWIVGLPVVAWYVLFRKRASLSDEENITKYGFLYTGLNNQAFYWEILLHFRKVLMICINVFMTTFKPLYRALIGFMLMIVYIEVLQKVQPYQTQEVNDLEFKANIAAFATFYGGLFFISSDLHFAVTIFLFLVILAVNAVFWITWLKMMFFTRYMKIREWISKNIFGGKYFAGAVQGDLAEIAQNNEEKMLQQQREGEFYEGEFDLPEDEQFKANSRSKNQQQIYQEDINEEEEDEEDKDNFGVVKKSSGSINQHEREYNAFSSLQKRNKKNYYRTVDQGHQQQNYGPDEDSNIIEDSYINQGAEDELYEFNPSTSKKLKDRAKEKKDRQSKKMRNIIESNDGYAPEDNNYDTTKNHQSSKQNNKNQSGSYKTVDIRQHSQNNSKVTPKNIASSNGHKKVPDESQDIVDDSISIQSSLDIDSNESYDIYQNDQQRKIKKQQQMSNYPIKQLKKEDGSQQQNNESGFISKIVMRKNTTVDKRGKKIVDDSFQSINNNSNDSTPAIIESGLGKSQTTQGASTMKNAGDFFDKNSSEKMSKDPSSIGSQQPQGKESKQIDSSDESTPKLNLRGDTNNIEQMRMIEDQKIKEREAQRDKSRKKSKQRAEAAITTTPTFTDSTPNSNPNLHQTKNQQRSDIDNNSRVRDEGKRDKSGDKERSRHRSGEPSNIYPNDQYRNERSRDKSRDGNQDPHQQMKATANYKKQMEKKGRNDESSKNQKPQQIDLSNKQEFENKANRTVLPQEKIFDKRQGGGDPMKLTAEERPVEYKKMQSRKIEQDRFSSSEDQQLQSPQRMKENPQNKREEEKRSKSRGENTGNLKRHQINDGGIEPSHRDEDQSRRKVSKLRPKNQRNDGIQNVTPSMFGKGQIDGSRQDDQFEQQQQDIESSEIDQAKNHRRQRRFEEEGSGSNQLQPQPKYKSKSRHKKSKNEEIDSGEQEGRGDDAQGKSRDRGGKRKRRDIRDSLSP